MKVRSLCIAFVFTLVSFSSTFAQASPHIVFQDFLKEYSSALLTQERLALLTRFWTYAESRGFPYIEENSTDVIFMYRGKDSVRVVGDFTSWSFRIPMKRLPDSDIWYVKLSFEPDARLDYKFYSESHGMFLDPLNPRTSEGGFGKNSELVMPAYIHAPEAEQQKNVHKGTLTTISAPSEILGYDRVITVYVPDRYDQTKRRYPVVYFNDGGDYLRYARATIILDNLIFDKQIEPIIGVFISPPAEPDRNRRTEYGLSRAYEKFLATELVPLIDKLYRSEPTAKRRLLVGASFGALSALSTALNYPDVFGNVGSHSAYASFRNDTITSLFQQATTLPLRIYQTVGTYERNISNDLPAGETDFLKANRSLRTLLERKGYPLRYREYRDGHSTAQWRNDLPQMLRWFFPAH